MKLNETQKSIVRLLFLNRKMSRKHLAEALRLSNPGLTLAAKPIVEEGIIGFAPKIVTGKAGRNEEPLCLNQKYGFFAGIDVTVNTYRLVLISLAGYTVYEATYDKVEDVKEKLHYYVTNAKVLNVCITFRHYGCHKPFNAHEQALYDAFKDFKEAPIQFENFITAVADIYHVWHHNDRNVLLIKYGPELGAAILVNGQLVKNQNGDCSQIGLSRTKDGKVVGDVVEFAKLFGKDLEEHEGTELLFEDEKKLDEVLDAIAFVAYNADKLSMFDDIVFAGDFVSNIAVKEMLAGKIAAFGENYDVEKISVMANYAEIYPQIPALESLISYFNKR